MWGEGQHSIVIGLKSFRKPMPLDCELKKSQEINTDTLLPLNFQVMFKFHQMSLY